MVRYVRIRYEYVASVTTYAAILCRHDDMYFLRIYTYYTICAVNISTHKAVSSSCCLHCFLSSQLILNTLANYSKPLNIDRPGIDNSIAIRFLSFTFLVCLFVGISG